MFDTTVRIYTAKNTYAAGWTHRFQQAYALVDSSNPTDNLNLVAGLDAMFPSPYPLGIYLILNYIPRRCCDNPPPQL